MSRKRIPRQAIIRGKRWKVRDTSGLKEWIQSLPQEELRENGLNPEEVLEGLCVYHTKTLWIPTKGITREDFETQLHEALHACTELDEAAVTEIAKSLADLLWALGWRREK
jgi:hypothetical protein